MEGAWILALIAMVTAMATIFIGVRWSRRKGRD